MVTLRRIRENDLQQIMDWRMDPEITRYMNTDPKLTLEGQLKWFYKIQSDPDVDYYMILVDEQEAGVLNLTGLTREDGILGWAYYIGEKKLRSFQSAITLELGVYDHIFDDLGKHALISDVFSLNRGVIQLHLLCGAQITEEKKGHIVKNGIAYDVTFMEMTRDNWYRIREGKKHPALIFPK